MLTMDGIVCIFSVVRLTAATVEAEPMRRQPHEAHSVTFTKNIAPILYRHCARCHRPDQAAPFSL